MPLSGLGSLGGLGDFGRLDDSFGMTRRAMRPAVLRPPLPEEDMPEISNGVLGHLGGALHYAASSLDKPGRALRGVLGGKPHEALAAIPFSDTLGITNPKDEVTGSQVNQQLFGMPDDNSWKSWGAGFLTEGVLDPLNLVTLGAKSALTQAGKQAAKLGVTKGLSRAQMLKGFDFSEDALRAAGKSADDIAHLTRQGKTIAPAGMAANQPLSGLAGYHLPFTNIRGAVGTGPLAQWAAGKMDKAGAGILAAPGVRHASALFDNRVNRAVTPEFQAGQRAYGAPAREAAGIATREMETDLSTQIDNIINAGHTDANVLRAVRMAAEGAVPSNVLQVDPHLWNLAQPVGNQIRAQGEEWLARSRELGLPQEALNDAYSNYVARLVNREGAGVIGSTPRGTLFPTGHASMISRRGALRDIPGGTEMLQRWSTDPSISGVGRRSTAPVAADRIRMDMINQAAAQGLNLTQDQIDALAKKSRQLSRYFGKRGDNLVSQGVPLFDQNIVGVMTNRAARHNKVATSADTLYKTIGDIAQQGAGGVPLTRALGKLPGGPNLVTHEAPGQAPKGLLVELHKALAKKGLGPTEAITKSGMTPEDITKALAADVGKFSLSPEAAQNLVLNYGKYQAPLEVANPLRGYDSFTNAFRNLTYGIWPNSQVRNLGSGVVQSLSHTGTGVRPYIDQWKLQRGTLTPKRIAQIHPDIPATLSGADARQALRNKQQTYANVYQGVGDTHDLLNQGSYASRMNGLSPLPPGVNTEGLIQAMVGGAAETTGKAMRLPNPRNLLNMFGPGGAFEMRGVGKGAEDFGLLRGMKRLGTEVEQFIRGSQYLGQTAKGVSPIQAGRDVLKTQFDYGDLTPFERNVMRRLVPFYTYARKNLPLTLQTMASEPRKLMPQLRLASQGDANDYVPEYLSSGVAIPTGPQDAQGNRQFVTQLGLPIEESLDRFKLNTSQPMDSLRNTGMAMLGMTNPLIKGPLEQIFDKQFFTGRNLSDLKPQGLVGSLAKKLDPDSRSPGIYQVLSQALANTPMTRFLTAADKITDPRKSAFAKALNLATGVRVSDVDVEKYRDIDTRKAIEALLKSSPAIGRHQSLYVRKGQEQNLRPEEARLLQALKRLDLNAREEAQSKRQRQPGT